MQQAITTADQLLSDDLGRSGLQKTDLDAYLAQEAELAAVGIKPHLYINQPGVQVPGYVIPYYDIEGSRAPFYRVRLFNPLPKGARYLQPANSGSWIYYPKSFAPLAKGLLDGKGRTKINGWPGAILITEGEKKAAKACREGFPACAVGGVYNWRTRTVILPEGTQLLKNRDNEIVAKIESGSTVSPTSDKRAFLANGLIQLIKFVQHHGLQIIIAFDSDNPRNLDVEAACAELAFEFRIHGIPTDRIRQLVLPAAPGSKMGLDDFLARYQADGLDVLLRKVVESKGAFPVHPNLKELVNRRLSGPLERSEAKELSLMLLTDMDRHGTRMSEKHTGMPYFFDSRSKQLMPVNLMQHHSDPLHETKFGEFLYRNYDVGQADLKLVQWLAAGFTGEQPVTQVEPRSVMALLPNNRFAYQVDDGHFALISPDSQTPIKIVENGTDGILFRSDQVEPVDHIELVKKFHEQLKVVEAGNYDRFFWPQALKTMKFVRPDDARMLSILYYMSPWLLRWSGTQLPVEIVVGEAGSGKSSMMSLRLQVINGRPALRNQPTDVRDWYASITSQDGLHATDNVHMVNKELRQRLSDEICRIVTEPAPYVEMRKLFTTSDNFRVPVRSVFAFTAIQQPFLNADILQRSIITELQAIGKDFSSDWAATNLKRAGGRAGILAQHLAVLHVFFKRVAAGEWDPNYKSAHRLAHFEQTFKLVARIMGVSEADPLLQILGGVSEAQVSEYDWIMEGLKEFNHENIHLFQQNPRKVFTLKDVAAWAEAKEDYLDNQVLINARKLSRYIKSHAFMVEKVAGFVPHGTYANSDAYRLVPIK